MFATATPMAAQLARMQQGHARRDAAEARAVIAAVKRGGTLRRATPAPRRVRVPRLATWPRVGAT
jgi:hypothetical protein